MCSITASIYRRITDLTGMNSMRDEISVDAVIGILCQKLPFLAEKYQEESLGVLGSYVHNSQRDDSDLDLLVTFRDLPVC